MIFFTSIIVQYCNAHYTFSQQLFSFLKILHLLAKDVFKFLLWFFFNSFFDSTHSKCLITSCFPVGLTPISNSLLLICWEFKSQITRLDQTPHKYKCIIWLKNGIIVKLLRIALYIWLQIWTCTVIIQIHILTGIWIKFTHF